MPLGENMAQDTLAIGGWVGGWVVFDQDNKLLIIVHEHKSRVYTTLYYCKYTSIIDIYRN